MPTIQKITPCLAFPERADEAAAHYVSIFGDAEILEVVRHGDAGPGPPGEVMLVRFRLEGMDFLALNGMPGFAFTEALSLSVDCATQEEVDRLWARLGEGGEPLQCGWIRDRYGLCWQIVPTVLPRLLQGDDPEGARRAFQAMLGMRKLDIAALERAYRGA